VCNKWFYRLKEKNDGTRRYKVRIVVKRVSTARRY